MLSATMSATAQNVGTDLGRSSDSIPVSASGTPGVRYTLSALGGGASGDFAPYMLGSWNNGKTAMAGTALVDAAVARDVDRSRRFSWGAGAEILTGYQAKADYQHYIHNGDNGTGSWSTHSLGPSAVWLQQLYATVKWRSVFMTVGMRERGSLLVDDQLSSGDLVHSNNARPIPQVRVGFVDFQDIPSTHGFAQILGCVAYGKTYQNNYLEDHFNYWNGHVATGALYVYRNLYLRSNPERPFSMMIGIQASSFFGGTTYTYYHGELTHTEHHEQNVKSFLKMFIPGGGDNWYLGSTLGSYDLRARWRTPDRRHEFSAYFQWLWEDGSGMAKRNKWDGLWGLQYTRTDGKHILQSAVIEYLDTHDQSGPLHWAPDDTPGTTITRPATGADDYYNNYAYPSYANFGMSLGSPMLVSPLYNQNGMLSYFCTRTRNVHVAATGWLGNEWRWHTAFSRSVGYGNGMTTLPDNLHNTSAMARADWDARRLLPGLTASAALAFDTGDLRGHSFGTLLTLTYTGKLLNF